MSLLPVLFSDWWEDLAHPHHLLDQNFGLGLCPDQLMSYLPVHGVSSPGYRPGRSTYYRPVSDLVRKHFENGSCAIVADKDKFQVVLDVHQFTPDEIVVKVVDKFVVVEGIHDFLTNNICILSF